MQHSQDDFRWSCGKIFNAFLCLHLTLHLLPCSLVRVTTLQLVLAPCRAPCGFHVGLLRHVSPLQPGPPSASAFTCRHFLDDGLIRCTVWSKTHPNRGLIPYQTCVPHLLTSSFNLFLIWIISYIFKWFYCCMKFMHFKNVSTWLL